MDLRLHASDTAIVLSQMLTHAPFWQWLPDWQSLSDWQIIMQRTFPQICSATQSGFARQRSIARSHRS
jgi:hypothetical protein